MKSTHTGSCHCGSVRFECDLDLADGTSKCNCSICTKGRFWKAIARAEASGYRKALRLAISRMGSVMTCLA